MTAIEAMRSELTRIQSAMADCITDAGYVRGENKYKYQLLLRESLAFKRAIEWMEGQKCAQ